MKSNSKKKLFDVAVFPMAEKMWLDQNFSGIEADSAEEAATIAAGLARKPLQADLLRVARTKSPKRICIARVEVEQVVGKNQDKVLAAKEFEYNV